MNPVINTKTEGDNGYIGFYKGKRVEVWAKTIYDAQKLAVAYFKAKKSWDVTVMIAETSDEKPVIHVPTM